MINVINREHITYCQHINYFNGIILKSKNRCPVEGYDPKDGYQFQSKICFEIDSLPHCIQVITILTRDSQSVRSHQGLLLVGLSKGSTEN
ncbi:hypothetical protein T4B_82 [Trichinella pseudospiralis]|uniref:Uncharacterized protein n=1 Tax=Trichinella pseudospiralis TaxID=6337 RepID=A0A0V1H933_TRIPS|nr:hypothetical protein T4B_82 [Trichinella pseudospiralis]